jgi:hypothetical protein
MDFCNPFGNRQSQSASPPGVIPCILDTIEALKNLVYAFRVHADPGIVDLYKKFMTASFARNADLPTRISVLHGIGKNCTEELTQAMCIATHIHLIVCPQNHAKLLCGAENLRILE